MSEHFLIDTVYTSKPFISQKHLKFREVLVIELLQNYINRRDIQIQAQQGG